MKRIPSQTLQNHLWKMSLLVETIIRGNLSLNRLKSIKLKSIKQMKITSNRKQARSIQTKKL